MHDRSIADERLEPYQATGTIHASRWPPWAWLLGHPLRIGVEQTIARDVPRAEYDDLVATVERFMRLEGRVVEIPGAVHWICGGRMGGTRVEFIPWRGGMGIRVVGRYWDRFLWMVLVWVAIGWMPGLVATAGLELDPSAGAIAIAAGYLLTYLGVCTMWHARGREQEFGLRALLDRLVGHLAPAAEATEDLVRSDVTPGSPRPTVTARSGDGALPAGAGVQNRPAGESRSGPL